MKRRRGSPGFTMLELITVMIVVGVMAVFALPRLELLRGYDEIGYRDKAKAAIQYARKAAIAQRRAVTVTVSDGNVSAAIQCSPPEAADAGCGAPMLNLTLPGADGGACGANAVCHPNGVTLTPAASIGFDAQGRVTSGAGVYTVSGTETATFTVEAGSGYVH